MVRFWLLSDLALDCISSGSRILVPKLHQLGLEQGLRLEIKLKGLRRYKQLQNYNHKFNVMKNDMSSYSKIIKTNTWRLSNPNKIRKQNSNNNLL